jgi:uncharacterized glyoxalase superfamily protein PhnB
MKVTASAISLNVPDINASAEFLKRHFGFTEAMSVPDQVASLTRADLGFNLIYLKTGMNTFKPSHRAGTAGEGLLIALVVENIDHEYERLLHENVPMATPIETEPWGERYFQVEDPNGIIVQLVQWVTEPNQETH